MAQITLNSTGVASNDSLVLQSNGTTAAVTIDTSQRVGINTTSPSTEGANAKVAIVGAAAQNASTLATSNSQAAFTIRADANSGYCMNFGNLVTSGFPYLQGAVFNGGASSSDIFLNPFGGNVGIGTTTNPAPNKLSVVGGSVQLSGGTTSQEGIRIQRASGYASITGINHDNNAFNPIAFFTSGTEAARIDTSGNVGIGTSSPTGKLHVSGFVLSGGQNYSARFSDAVNSTYSITHQSGLTNLITDTAMAFYTSNTERMRIDTSGRVLVNSTSDVGGNNPVFSANAGAATFSNIMEARWTGTGSIYHLLIRNGNGLIGGVTSSASTTSFVTSSDYRLKDNISPMTGALAKVSALKPVTYKWKVDGSVGEGFIAHELAEVCPIAVHGEKDELNEDGSIKSQSIDTSFLVATLTAAIQEQQALITALTARITALESA
jgi:hypothetical protein